MNYAIMCVSTLMVAINASVEMAIGSMLIKLSALVSEYTQ